MGLIINVILAYLTINLVGSIIEIIRYSEGVVISMREFADTNGLSDRYDNDLHYRRGFVISFIGGMILGGIIYWAPMRLIQSMKNEG